MYSRRMSPYSCGQRSHSRGRVIMENKMSALAKLSFVELPVTVARDVTSYKRKRLIDRVEEQRALLRDPNYTKTVKRWNAKKGAPNRAKVEKKVRMTPCWRSLPAGGFAVTLRIG